MPPEDNIPTANTEAIRAAARKWASRQPGRYCARIRLGPIRTPVGRIDTFFTTTSPCNECSGCAKGNGMWYRFRGRWQGSQYLLLVSAAGAHSGGPRPLRLDQRPAHPERGRTTVTDKESILQIAEDIKKEGSHPFPFEVHSRMLQRECKQITPASLRCMLQVRFGKHQMHRKKRPVTWTAEFEAYIQRHVDMNGPIAFVHHVVGPVITSFVFCLPKFLDELQVLHSAGVLRDVLAGNMDCTFRVEWRGYVFGILYIILYRNIRGRWRKTSWPVFIVVHPREDLTVYDLALTKLKDELGRRGLPTLRQLGMDHFPGIADKYRELYPAGQVKQGLGHMLQNLRKYQMPRHRLSVPRLHSHSLGVIRAHIHATSTLATKTMFHLAWKVTHQRIRHVWDDAKWSDYFLRTYHQHEDVEEQNFGTCALITATWHFGMCAPGLRGHGPSQQPPEQGHANLKRSIASLREDSTMQDVLEEIKKVANSWTSPPCNEGLSFF